MKIDSPQILTPGITGSIFISNLTNNATGYVLTIDNTTGQVYKSPGGGSGSSGSSGTAGSSGSSGTAGSSGTSGFDGSSGTSGFNGSSGTSGLDGSSGTAGTAGTSGIDGNNLITGSTYPITGSWSINSLYSVTASYALNGGGSSLSTGSYYPITSSWAINALTASYVPVGNSVTATFISSSTWTFNHGLNSRLVVIQAFDYFYNQIIPSNVYLNNINTSTLSFPSLESGFVIATRSGLRIFSGSGGGGANIYTGSLYPITASWAINVVSGSSSTPANSVVGTFTSSSTWTFNHNLGTRPVLIQAYDINYNQIVPQDIVLNNNNTAILTFPINESGYAIAARSGLRIISGSGANLITGSSYPITASWSIYALNGGTSIFTGSTYPITSSWANNVVSASYSLTSSYSNNSTSASYSLTASQIGCEC